MGDSLSTAYGINQDQGWVNLLTARLKTAAIDASVINQSISGQTTAAGLAQLPKALATHQPNIVILELGGNDGLQGLQIEHIKHNLSQLITLSQQANAKVLLLGMQLPPNYGTRYTDAFKAIYPALTQQYHVSLVPFFLEGVGGYLQYMQGDSIHPTTEAQGLMLDNVWPYLQQLL